MPAAVTVASGSVDDSVNLILRFPIVAMLVALSCEVNQARVNPTERATIVPIPNKHNTIFLFFFILIFLSYFKIAWNPNCGKSLIGISKAFYLNYLTS